MIDVPRSTMFGRRIPKTKFYENISMTSQLRRVFVEQIERIEWQNKIATSTTNLAVGQSVKEIEIFLVRLNQRGLDQKALTQIDKEIPYHLLFLLEYRDEQQAWIAYKEASKTKAGTFKPGVYYHTEWMPKGSRLLTLDGLNMDAVYESLIRQVAGARLASDDASGACSIEEAIDRDGKRQKLLREIAVLERKIQNEKQFNRQVALNEELKRLRGERIALEGKCR